MSASFDSNMRASRLIWYVTPLAHTSCAGSTGGRSGSPAASPGDRPSRKPRTSAAGSPSNRSSANSDGRYRPSSAQRAPPSVRCLDRYMKFLLSRAMPQTTTTATRLRGASGAVSVGCAPAQEESCGTTTTIAWPGARRSPMPGHVTCALVCGNEEDEDGDPAGHPPHRVRSGGSLHVPVPPRRGGPHGPGGHRPRRDAGGGHNPVPGGDRSLAGGHRRGHRQPRRRGHCGGNRALKERHRSLWFSCGEPDRAWIENNELMLSDIYRWYEPYGFGLDEESKDWIRTELGGDSPVDAGLRGGETMRLGPDWRIEILHLPGHTPGHLGIWDPKNGAAIIIDAALETGIYDREGNRLIPPRYFDAARYQNTIRKLQTLRPEHLLTAHYPPMQGQAALDFLDLSLEFTERVHGVVREGLQDGTTDLRELTRRADARLGPYPQFSHELAAGVRAHLAML